MVPSIGSDIPVWVNFQGLLSFFQFVVGWESPCPCIAVHYHSNVALKVVNTPSEETFSSCWGHH